MSEYQYFEFQAIDRPLTKKDMAEPRSYSTRARITPTSFINGYSWGNFKGNADVWMDKYFDAFLYFANWGTRILKLRLADSVLSAKTARLYAAGESAAVRVKNGHLMFTFLSENEDRDEDSIESEGWLASIISVRAELALGDLRALYLGWLLCAQGGELDPSELSPPVPAGLAKLSASLTSLIEFLRIDRNLVRISANPAVKNRNVASLMRDLESGSRKQRRAAASAQGK